jgi:hypothetical protein
MSEYKVKLAAALPKMDANGLDYTITAELAEAGLAQHHVAPRVAILVYDLKKAEVDADGVATAVLRIRRVEPVQTNDGRRAVEGLLESEFSHRTGSPTVPYELAVLSRDAFADLPRTPEEIDEKEAREQDMMSPTDELRAHLRVVHGTEDAHLLTAEGADEQHRADHDGALLMGSAAHEADWIGWTRADLELAAAESLDESPNVDEHLDGAGIVHPVDPWAGDESEPAETNVVRAEHSMQADDDQDDNVVSLFSEGTR